MKIRVCDVCRHEIGLGSITIPARKLEIGSLMEGAYFASVDVCQDCVKKIAEFVIAARTAKIKVTP